MEVTVIARAKAKPGCEASVEKELRKVVGPTHQEAGCLRYALHRGLEDPSVVVVVERWASKEDLDKHLGTPHVQALFRQIPAFVAALPEILVLELLPEGDSPKGQL